MENSQTPDVPSEGQNGNGSLEDRGYDTPGRDAIRSSTSDVVHSPSQTSRDRLQTPKQVIESFGQKPGSANPARGETTGFEQGQMSTADLLRAREFAEEEYARSPGKPQPYQDQTSAASTEETRDQDVEEINARRANWPDDEPHAPNDLMGSPHDGETLMTSTPDVFGLDATGRQDEMIERERMQASQSEYGSAGLPSTGFDRDEEIYERRDLHEQGAPSDLDEIAPRMSNVAPPEE